MRQFAYAAAMSDAEKPTPEEVPVAAASAPGSRMSELVEVMRRLLAPDGCPWDREQTLESLKPYLLEETYELVEAMDSGDQNAHREELGDLLFQVVFQSAIRQARGEFAIDDVIAGIADKLRRRHPHVFADRGARDARGDRPATSADQVRASWEAIKAREKRERAGPDAPPPSLLAGVPVALPALTRAQKLTARAARVGFDWPDDNGCWAKLDEELGELKAANEAADRSEIFNEIGDLLLSIVNLSRRLGLDAESALRAANRRFSDRFGHVESRLRDRGVSLEDASLAEMDALWDQAKRPE